MVWSCNSWFLWYKRCISTGYPRSFLIFPFRSYTKWLLVQDPGIGQKDFLFLRRYHEEERQVLANTTIKTSKLTKKQSVKWSEENKRCQKLSRIFKPFIDHGGQISDVWHINCLTEEGFWLTLTVVHEWILSLRLKDRRLLAWASQTLTTSPEALPSCNLTPGRPNTGLVVIPLPAGIECCYIRCSNYNRKSNLLLN